MLDRKVPDLLPKETTKMSTTRFDAIQPPEAAFCISPARQHRECWGVDQSPRRGRHETHRACARRNTWRPLRGLKELTLRLSRRLRAGLIQRAPSGRSKAHARESTDSLSTQMVWLGSTARSAGTMLAPCAEPDEGGREAGGSARKKGIGAERRYKFVGYPKAFVSPADAGSWGEGGVFPGFLGAPRLRLRRATV
jgi:hypothetical protein